jgi:dienelactone hydrolase
MTFPAAICVRVMSGLCAMLLALSLAAAFAEAPSAAPRRWHHRAVFVGHAPLKVRCGSYGTTLPADWYFPGPASRKASGLVWVQHGFFRTKQNIASLARYIAAHTRAIVVAPTISSNPFAPGGCWINGAPMQRAVAELFAQRSALQRSADAARHMHVALPAPFVLTGHSAGGSLATAAAGYTTLAGGAIADLRAVVLYDAVNNASAMNDALGRLTGADDRPVLQIASPPSPCNAFSSGTRALLSARPGRFIGVQLVGGTHIDAEGPDSGPFARAVCGSPLKVNITAVRSIASDWITNALTGSSNGIVAGSPGEAIPVNGAIAIVLPVH